MSFMMCPRPMCSWTFFLGRCILWTMCPLTMCPLDNMSYGKYVPWTNFFLDECSLINVSLPWLLPWTHGQATVATLRSVNKVRLKRPMRPKAREMTQHGGPPGCMAGEEWPSRGDLCCDGRSKPPSLTPDKKENQIFLIRKFRMEQLRSHTVYEEGLRNIWRNAQIFNHIWGGR